MANNFAADPSCLALWRFEPGALTTDSIGANTLTPTASAPTSDATNLLEGAGSAGFAYASSQAYTLPDVGLPANFPLKNGTTNRIFTLFGRTRMTYQNSWRTLVAKRNYSNKYSFGVTINGARLNIIFGYNSGNTWQIIDTGIDFPLNNWASWVVSVDNSTKSFWVLVRRSDNGNFYYYSGTYANDIWLSDAAWSIGGHSDLTAEFFGGQADEIGFFNRVSDPVEAAQIINQTFNGATGGEILVGGTGVKLVYTEQPMVQVGGTGTQLVYTDPPSMQVGGVGVLLVYNDAPPVPPAKCSSATTVQELPPLNLDNLSSPSRIESITAPLADIRVQTLVEDIPSITLANCVSPSIAQPLLLAVPHTCQSKGRIMDIPPFNEGLFLIF